MAKNFSLLVILIAAFLVLSCGADTENNAENKDDQEEKENLNENDANEDETLNMEENLEDEPTVDEWIEIIIAQYQTIESESDNYTREVIELPDVSTEGGEIIYHYKGQEIKKIVENIYGELGRAESTYYFWDAQLFFVFTQDYKYEKPVYMEDNSIKEIVENRYYFHNGKLISWLDQEKNKVPNENFSDIQSQLIAKTEELLNPVDK